MEINHFASPGMIFRQVGLVDSMYFVCSVVSLLFFLCFLKTSHRHEIIVLMIKNIGSVQGAVWYISSLSYDASSKMTHMQWILLYSYLIVDLGLIDNYLQPLVVYSHLLDERAVWYSRNWPTDVSSDRAFYLSSSPN